MSLESTYSRLSWFAGWVVFCFFSTSLQSTLLSEYFVGLGWCAIWTGFLSSGSWLAFKLPFYFEACGTVPGTKATRRRRQNFEASCIPILNTEAAWISSFNQGVKIKRPTLRKPMVKQQVNTVLMMFCSLLGLWGAPALLEDGHWEVHFPAEQDAARPGLFCFVWDQSVQELQFEMVNGQRNGGDLFYVVLGMFAVFSTCGAALKLLGMRLEGTVMKSTF